MLSEHQKYKARTLQRLIHSAHIGTGKTLVMGVLNVTPDSFSDGGLYIDVPTAVAHSIEMVENGADIIDIGGESTRPATFQSSGKLTAAEEIMRILPVIEALTRAAPDIPISIDTYRAATARAAFNAGAVMINDVSAGRADVGMPGVMAQFDAPVCLMHMLGFPNDISTQPEYSDVTKDVMDHLTIQMGKLRDQGVLLENIVLDPGIGFGKSLNHNLQLLHELPQLVSLGQPVLVGTSRKSFIGSVLGGLQSNDRLEGTAATIALSIASGASIVRVHDVREMARVVKMTDTIVKFGHLDQVKSNRRN